MSCEECRPLVTHTFRTPDDLIHAVRLATEEMERGVLERIPIPAAAGRSPDVVHYGFQCLLCGDRFTLYGDARQGTGAWTREEDSQ